ncbi:hypothetical protein ACIOGZ_28835 [Kitasatospora sp. NPDC088160]|uniref:hypothetical protein n=1 Tax=Kitasatospora sp. NPDC088160 TaxID=3364072 RepID=UPI0038040ABF
MRSMIPGTTVPNCCSRCGRSRERADNLAVWNDVWKRGVLTGYICPGCQTSEEAVEAAVNATLVDYSMARIGMDGRARSIMPGTWHTVSAIPHTTDLADPTVHLMVQQIDRELRIAVAGHGDADLVAALAPGICSSVARTALEQAGDHGLHWNTLPTNQRQLLHIPSPEPGRPEVDLAALMLRTRAEDWEWDRTYTRVAPRRPVPDLTGLVATDISDLRCNLVAPSAFTDQSDLNPARRLSQVVAATTTTAAYLAVDHSHFIPTELALDVATTAALDAETFAALRLPGPWSMVIHEPIPVSTVQAGDEELEAVMDSGVLIGTQHAVLGAVLAAHDDGTLDTTLGLVLTTHIDNQGRRLRQLQPAAFGDHPAPRQLRGPAGLRQLARARSTAAADQRQAGLGEGSQAPRP